MEPGGRKFTRRPSGDQLIRAKDKSACRNAVGFSERWSVKLNLGQVGNVNPLSQ
jgi:hypothetical protein